VEPYEVEWLWEYGTALSIPTGEPQWYRSTPGVIATEETVVATAADLEHPPVAVDRTEPGLRWHIDELINERAQEFYRTPVPVAAGGDVFVHTANRLCRIAGDDVVWTVEGDLWAGDKLRGERSELYVTGSVVRIDPQDGTTRGTERARERGVATGLAVGEHRAVQSFRVDSPTRGVVTGYGRDWGVDWEVSLGAQPTRFSPAVHDGRAFVLTNRGTVSINLADGTVSWRSEDAGERGGLALDENGIVYVPHSDEALVALDATDGTRQWTAAVSQPLRSLIGERGRGYAPIVTADAVVLAGWDGVAILDRTDGSLRWHAEWDLVGAPAVAFGDLYAITTNGVVAVRGN